MVKERWRILLFTEEDGTAIPVCSPSFNVLNATAIEATITTTIVPAVTEFSITAMLQQSIDDAFFVDLGEKVKFDASGTAILKQVGIGGAKVRLMLALSAEHPETPPQALLDIVMRSDVASPMLPLEHCQRCTPGGGSSLSVVQTLAHKVGRVLASGVRRSIA